MSRNEFSAYGEAFLSTDPLLEALREHHPEQMPVHTVPLKPVQPVRQTVSTTKASIPSATASVSSYLPEQIVNMTREVFKSSDDRFFTTRQRQYADARFAASYLIRLHCPWMKFKGIGTFVGNRDHTTVINGIKKAGIFMDPAHPKYSPIFAERMAVLEERVQQLKTNALRDAIPSD